MDQQPTLLREREVCRLLGCSPSSLWRRVNDGTLPKPVKIGHLSRFVAAEISEAIDVAKEQRGQ